MGFLDAEGEQGSFLDRHSSDSLHSQISNFIQDQISSGEWPSNYRLHAEPDLAKEFGVSRGTLRRAMETLISRGLLRKVQGRGTFVTSAQFEPAIAQKLISLYEEFETKGSGVTTQVIGKTIVEAPQPIARLLDVPTGHTLLKLTRLRVTPKGPVALLLNYVRVDLAPGLETVDFASTGLFAVLESRYQLRIGSGRRTFAAEGAPENVARELLVPLDFPVQYLEQVTYLTDGRPLEYSDVWINSQLLRVTSLLSRRKS